MRVISDSIAHVSTFSGHIEVKLTERQKTKAARGGLLLELSQNC